MSDAMPEKGGLEVWEHRIRVGADAVDEQGHVNNVEYVRWMQDAAIAHSDALGWPAARYVELDVAWVVRSHTIRYRLPAFLDDEVTVRTCVADLGRARSLRRFVFLRASDGAELASAETDWAMVCRSNGAPRRIPTEVAASFPVAGDTGASPAARAE